MKKKYVCIITIICTFVFCELIHYFNAQDKVILTAEEYNKKLKQEYDLGYEDGFSASYDNGYSAGYDTGSTDGYANGVEFGISTGYNQGVNDGIDATGVNKSTETVFNMGYDFALQEIRNGNVQGFYTN